MKECSVQAHSQTKKRKKRPSASDSGSDDQDRPDHGDEADKDDVFAESSEKPAMAQHILNFLWMMMLFESLKLIEEQIQRRAATGQYVSVYEYRKEACFASII